MNRRRLILTGIGALAGCLGLPKVALAVAGLAVLPPVGQRSLMYAPGVPNVRIGSLIINSEAEAQWFLTSMANAIHEASKRGYPHLHA